MTIHINEEDVYKTYNEHIKELKKNQDEAQNVLKLKSSQTEKCLFQRGKNSFKFRHLITPGLIFTLPSYTILENSLFLKRN